MSLEDKDFSYWYNYFTENKPKLTEFLCAIDLKDTYYVNSNPQAEYNDELYDDLYMGGFIEGDFRRIMRAEEEEDVSYYHTRIALFLFKGLSINDLKKSLNKEVIEQIIGDSLINGKYEEFGIEFHQIMSIIFKNKVCEMDSMMDWGFLYGTNVGQRYGEDFFNNKELKKIVEKNNKEIENIKKIGINEPTKLRQLGLSNDKIDEDEEEDMN